ncbi:protein of unknown function [Candidatus Hydrogenisulfobacillus filiaventi]|uniref:Uncharacterized protein n=1 Tax=Candidatus Hydrogenisulfobacillus filiaventi TaxID=2707344 RepID=A0A6F8ZHQ1_9FIRM|nr:protein of unknown function [Candidatus Hydrogenisulfobacillus filiaventi]
MAAGPQQILQELLAMLRQADVPRDLIARHALAALVSAPGMDAVPTAVWERLRIAFEDLAARPDDPEAERRAVATIEAVRPDVPPGNAREAWDALCQRDRERDR